METKETRKANAGNRPAHLPNPLKDPKAYEGLYCFNSGVDDYLEDVPEWKEIRIRSGSSELDVYRLLPSASNHEYGGYLTKTRIRYYKGEENQANTLKSKACTFHSHPTRSPKADVPSVQDVYSFLKYRHRRTVTVGRNLLWVWDKTAATLTNVRRLAKFETDNLVAEVKKLQREHPNSFHEPYMRIALKNLGFDWPKKVQELEEIWPERLRSILRMKVRVFQRFPQHEVQTKQK